MWDGGRESRTERKVIERGIEKVDVEIRYTGVSGDGSGLIY